MFQKKNPLYRPIGNARCDVIQGLLFSRPLNAREFKELIISVKYLFFPKATKQDLVSKE
jgi:hypothetical protein